MDHRVNNIVNNLVRTVTTGGHTLASDIAERSAMPNADPAEQLTDRLRADLGRGEYHPRERLVESELVSRYGFPRGAVRSALLLLAAEGLVDRSPNRGASVRGLSIDEGIEIAEVRRELETLCARDAALRATAEEREHLRSGLAAMLYTVGEDDVHSYRQTSIGFHEAVIVMSRHEGARRQLATIRLHNLQRHFPAAFQGSLADSAEDHIAIGGAIIAADADAAGSLMYEHLSRIVAFLSAYRDIRTVP